MVVNYLKQGLESFKRNPIGAQFNEIYQARHSISVAIVLSVGLSIMFIQFMSWFAECLGWIVIVVTQIGLLLSIVFTGYQWKLKKEQYESYTDIQKENVSFEPKHYLYLCIFFGILNFVYSACVCCFFKQIKMALNVIDASADFLTMNKRVILVPIVQQGISIACILVWAAAYGQVYSIGEVVPVKEIPQMRYVKVPAAQKDMVRNLKLFMIFGILWITAFTKAVSQFVILASTSQYYFNSNREEHGTSSITLSYKFACFKHAGSIAFGSAIIAIIRFIEYVFV